MRQLSAFPTRLMSVDPADLGTVDAALFGTGDNGVDYCVKTVAKTPMVPAAEMICYRLAEACGIAVPQFEVVELPSGELAFGSVWDPSAADQQASIDVLQGQTKGKEVGRNLARIYAFDLFVHNVDRHMNNYLCVRGRLPGHLIKAYDFSRAFSALGWPPPPIPMQATAPTMQVFRHLHKIHTFAPTDCVELLLKVRALPTALFKTTVDDLPKPWADPKLRKRMIKWWAEDRGNRIDQIIGGINDGSLL